VGDLQRVSGSIHPMQAGTCLQMLKEELEGYLAEGLSLEQIGRRTGRDSSTVSYHLKKHGLAPVGHDVHGLTRRSIRLRLKG
jgi:hypothetical protein